MLLSYGLTDTHQCQDIEELSSVEVQESSDIGIHFLFLCSLHRVQTN